jgi:hypothetical protein
LKPGDQTCKNTVEIKTLDDVWIKQMNREHVFMIKIDIEGYEPSTILGAMTMLRESPPPFIFMEVTPISSKGFGLSVSRMLKDLFKLGYKIRLGIDWTAKETITPDTPQFNELFNDAAPMRDIVLMHDLTYRNFVEGSIEF